MKRGDCLVRDILGSRLARKSQPAQSEKSPVTAHRVNFLASLERAGCGALVHGPGRELTVGVNARRSSRIQNYPVVLDLTQLRV